MKIHHELFVEHELKDLSTYDSDRSAPSYGLEKKPDRREEAREILPLFRLLIPQLITKR